ncbi:hypothetical protein VNO80_10350 [Phaseolus coccineus]|uniref:Uncharacterized protein n=1 Tax=Phaseolus coccineus TaxID=3886 RepID=A0AAN9N7Y5_PHACN
MSIFLTFTVSLLFLTFHFLLRASSLSCSFTWSHCHCRCHVNDHSHSLVLSLKHSDNRGSLFGTITEGMSQNITVLATMYNLFLHVFLAFFNDFLLEFSIAIFVEFKLSEFQEIPEKYWIGKRRLLLFETCWEGLATYGLFGVLWLYTENSSLGWGKLKPRLKEHKEALKDFIGKGRMIGTVVTVNDFQCHSHDT